MIVERKVGKEIRKVETFVGLELGIKSAESIKKWEWKLDGNDVWFLGWEFSGCGRKWGFE